MRKQTCLRLPCLVGLLALASVGGCIGDTSNSGTAPNWGGATSPIALGSTWRIDLTTPGTSYQSSNPTVVSISGVMTDNSGTTPVDYVQLTALAVGQTTLSQIDTTGKQSAGFEIKSADKLGLYLLEGPPGSDADGAEFWVHTKAGFALRYYVGGAPLWGKGAYKLANVTAYKVTTVPDVFLVEAINRPAMEALDLTSGGAHLAVPIHIVADADVTQFALTAETPPAAQNGTAPTARIWGTGTTAGGATVYGIPFDWTVDAATFPNTMDPSVQLQGDVFRYLASANPPHQVSATFNGHSQASAFNGAAKDITWQYVSGCDLGGMGGGRRAASWPALALIALSMWIVARRRRAQRAIIVR